jgi:hypothetical protein
LGLIFLKYISDVFSEVYNELRNDPEKLADPEDKDEYKARNVFWVPSKARWDTLQKNAKQPTIGIIIDDVMDAIERENASLKGVLPKNYAREGLDKQRVGELIDLVGTIGLGDSALTPTPTHPLPTSSSTPIPQFTSQEEVRGSVMDYIASKHPETAGYMANLSWTGGRATPVKLIGAETYMYFAGGWNVTIQYPVVPNPIYQVSADYKAPGAGIPANVIWQGTYLNQVINETNYVFAQ